MPMFNSVSWLDEKQRPLRASLSESRNSSPDFEAWRYLAPDEFYAAQKIAQANSSIELKSNSKEYYFDLLTAANYQLVFYNGKIQPKYSKVLSEADQQVQSFSDIISTQVSVAPIAEERLFFEDQLNDDYFSKVNLAHFQDGAVVNLKSDKNKRPIIAIVHFYGSDADAGVAMTYPRNTIQIAKDTEATIIELHIALTESSAFVINSTNLFCGENSKIDMLQYFQMGKSDLTLSYLKASISRAARFNFFGLNLGGYRQRTDNVFLLNGADSEVSIMNLAKCQNAEQLDVRTSVTHKVGQTKSRQTVKNILLGSSKVSFTGKLRIALNAQKSDASQYCHNLILSRDAEANACPQLEVEADDVKAAHGSTMGRINDEELFYLQSRGIEKRDAELILSNGFQAELIEQMDCVFLKGFIKNVIIGAQR